MLFTIQRSLLLLAMIGVSLMALACDDDNKNTGVSQSPIIEINPTDFVFFTRSSQELATNPVNTSAVVISNVGLANLKLASINMQTPNLAELNLKWYQGNLPLADATAQGILQEGISSAGNSFPDILELAPNEKITLVLEFRAANETSSPSGSVRFQSNDRGQIKDEIIPIRSQGSEAQINVSPNPLDVGRVVIGQTGQGELIVTNLGTSTLNLNQMTLNGDMAFSVALKQNGANPILDPSALTDPDQDGTPGIEPGKFAVFTVSYAPMIQDSGVAQLVISNNDPINAQYIVNLTANGAAPCINIVLPGSLSTAMPEYRYDEMLEQDVLHVKLDFPPTLINRPALQDVVIESCGSQALQVSNITYQGSDAFVVQDLPSLPIELPANQNIGNGPAPSGSFKVQFTPTDTTVYEGAIVIESNDSANRKIIVDIVGRGSLNECPMPVLVQSEIDALPLDILNLDASASTDRDGPNGKPVEYIWTVIQRPNGSTAQVVERLNNPALPADGGPADNTSTPNALFFVDIAGDYLISLKVKDNQGFEAPSSDCPMNDVVLSIHAVPNEDLHIQMVWHTPQDNDETDLFGTDVDLHLFHPAEGFSNNGFPLWSTTPGDCYWANVNPEWGAAGPTANPSLDIDDTNGAGPENINLDNPEDTVRLGRNYRVGVEYYNAEPDFITSMTSDVTVRIYVSGQLAGEWEKTMRFTGEQWEVADIIWSAGDHRVVAIP